MADVTLRQMQYFVAVVDCGSMTAAANAEHVSQAALSMSIAQLEKALGTHLLIRTRSKRVVPTQLGLQFAAHVRRILDGVDTAVDTIADSSGALRGTLRVGCSFTLSPRLVPELITRFEANYPQVTIEFTEGPAKDIQDEVRMGRLDLCLLYSRQADEDLHQNHLTEVTRHLVVPAEHPLAAHSSVSVAEFIDMDAIFLNVPPATERLIADLQGVGHTPRIRYTSGNIQTIFSLVARGYGYSLVNSPPAANETYDGRQLGFVPVRDAMEPNAIVAVTAVPQSRVPRRVIAAVEALRGV